jgi:hypothetical protein
MRNEIKRERERERSLMSNKYYTFIERMREMEREEGRKVSPSRKLMRFQLMLIRA